MDNLDLESRIMAQGRDFFDLIKDEAPSIFNKGWNLSVATSKSTSPTRTTKYHPCLNGVPKPQALVAESPEKSWPGPFGLTLKA